MAADRIPFHKKCLKCEQCKKNLTPGNINTHQEKKIYCQNCYNNIFKPQVNIFTLSNDDTIVQVDDVPDKKKMQVLPIGGSFKVVSNTTLFE